MRENLRNRKLANVARRRVVLWAFLLLLAACTNNETATEHDTYTCPMHPTVVSDRPGSCPVCGMDLVRKARADEKTEITEDLARLLKSPNENVVSSVKTIKGQYKSIPVSIEAQGVVTYDTRNIRTISARVGGRLEKIYLKYAFQAVAKGQKIAEVYSPELITAQRELLFVLENDPENELLIHSAKKKLDRSGFSKSQIKNLISRRETSHTFNVYSPYEGYLITEMGNAPSASTGMRLENSAGNGMDDGMGTSTPAASSPSSTRIEAILREGDYVAAGQKLFTIVDGEALRIDLDLPGDHGGTVRVGSKVELNFGDGQDVPGTVDFVQPFFTESETFSKVRVYTDKKQDLRIGQLVKATIDLGSTEALWVPREAVLDLGIQKVVFLEERGVLKPKAVTTGASVEGMIEIKSGLASAEKIAKNAQYLVDSESFIRIKE